MSVDPEATTTGPDAAVAGPRRRFQFSLATLLWLTTVVACLAAVFGMYLKLGAVKAEADAEVARAKMDVQAANEEVHKYRGEMGYLEVSDPTKLYACRMTGAESDKWSWRVYVPKERKYRLCIATERIPLSGVSTARDNMAIRQGEHLIAARAEPVHDDIWHFHVKVADSRDSRSVEIASLNGDVSDTGVNGTKQVTVDSNHRLVLLRVRKLIAPPGPQQDFRKSVVDPMPCEGFMIWIEEQK